MGGSDQPWKSSWTYSGICLKMYGGQLLGFHVCFFALPVKSCFLPRNMASIRSCPSSTKFLNILLKYVCLYSSRWSLWPFLERMFTTSWCWILLCNWNGLVISIPVPNFRTQSNCSSDECPREPVSTLTAPTPRKSVRKGTTKYRDLGEAIKTQMIYCEVSRGIATLLSNPAKPQNIHSEFSSTTGKRLQVWKHSAHLSDLLHQTWRWELSTKCSDLWWNQSTYGWRHLNEQSQCCNILTHTSATCSDSESPFPFKSRLKGLFMSHINTASLTSNYWVLVVSFSVIWKNYVISKICW